MKCLNCGQDQLPLETVTCPNPACRVHLPSLMRDMLPPGTLLRDGAYKIDYALGQGGFGITYRGFSIFFNESVAIKEFFPQTLAMRESDSGHLMVPTTQQAALERWQGRFLREGQMLRQLSQPMPHPHLVQVKDLFEERGTAYMVMELVEGHSLGEELEHRPRKRLTEAETQRIMAGLVDALSAVHAQNIYHLDIKPDNVLLRPNGEPVLVDFGAARYGLEQATMKRKRSSSRAFTLDYAPPELLTGETLGPESDIFELGMMLHEMLTGVLPPGVLSREKGEVWEPQDLGQPWQELVREALRYSRQQRPSNVKAWWLGVSGVQTIPILHTEPQRSEPQPLPVPLSPANTAPQHRLGGSAGALLGTAVIVMGLAGTVGYLVAKNSPAERPITSGDGSLAPPAPSEPIAAPPSVPSWGFSTSDSPTSPPSDLDPPSPPPEPLPPANTSPSPETSKITYYGQEGTYTVDYEAGTYYGCTDAGCLALGPEKRVSYTSWRNGNFLYVISGNEVFVENNGSIIFSDTFN